MLDHFPDSIWLSRGVHSIRICLCVSVASYFCGPLFDPHSTVALNARDSETSPEFLPPLAGLGPLPRSAALAFGKHLDSVSGVYSQPEGDSHYYVGPMHSPDYDSGRACSSSSELRRFDFHLASTGVSVRTLILFNQSPANVRSLAPQQRQLDVA